MIAKKIVDNLYESFLDEWDSKIELLVILAPFVDCEDQTTENFI